jgi:hypothetical protein
VKLGDLGLAKSSDQQQGLTMTGASMGTPLYISPEQAEGKRDIDLRTDIYSLGATLYHLIAGVPPYTADSAISVMMKHVGAPVPDVRSMDSSIPAVLASVILRMMQKAPEERYASYEDLGADLQRAYASLSDATAVDAQDSAVPTGGPSTSGVAKGDRTTRSFRYWLIPAVVVPLVALGVFVLRKSTVPTSGDERIAHGRSSSEADPALELVRRLEAKLLPVPGAGVLMCKTELTVGEWKLYLRSVGFPEWQQPDQEWEQTDEHPVVKVTWEDVTRFAAWLSAKTGREWRLPTVSEWEMAVGKVKYPWGDYFPPNWDDGNFCFLENGKDDPLKVGVDRIKGTAPVASFKPNPGGFYDLGGNALEWMVDYDKGKMQFALRGCGWRDGQRLAAVAENVGAKSHASNNIGFRLVRSSIEK